jgi:hypothetical protein
MSDSDMHCNMDAKALAYMMRTILLHRMQVCRISSVLSQVVALWAVLALGFMIYVGSKSPLWVRLPEAFCWSGAIAVCARSVLIQTKELKRLKGADRVFKDFLDSDCGNVEQLQGATQTTLG